MKTKKNYNVDLASLSDKKLLYDFAKWMNSDLNAPGMISNRNRTLMKLLKSTILMISDSGISITIFLPSDPSKLYNRLKLLLQENLAGNTSDIINKEIFAIVHKLLE